MQSKKQEIFDHFLFIRLHTLVFSFISSGVYFILYGVLHIVVIRIVQQPFRLINHLSLTPVLLLYLIHIYKLLFDLHYPGSLTASNLTLGGSFTRYSTLCIWMTTFCIWQVGYCGLQTYQTEMKLKRATTVEFNAITPICYIHCYALLIFVF